MSTVTHPTQPTVTRTSFVPTGSGLSFTGLLRSESIKLWSLRSTYWSFGLVIVAAIGIAVLMAFSMSATVGFDPATGAAMGVDDAQILVLVATTGLSLGQLIVAVLGVLSISGEYSSGMIKSTLSAVPNRLPALWAKVCVLFAFTFLVGLVSVLGSFLIATPILGTEDISVSLFDNDVLLPLLGNVLFLAFIAVFAIGIGTILRSSAGGIATVLGITMLLPVVLGILSSFVDWIGDILPFLFTMAGSTMANANTANFPDLMEPWQALLVVLAWLFVSLGTAALLLKRRDA